MPTDAGDMESACDVRASARPEGGGKIGGLSEVADEVGRSADELEEDCLAKDGEARDGREVGALDGLSCSALPMTVGEGRAGTPWWDIVPPPGSEVLAAF